MFKKKEIEFKLIYKATKDGDSIDNFHYHCDNISNTLIIIKINENKIFSGFTTELLNLDNSIKQDDFTFLFSVDKQKIYKMQKYFGEYALHSDKGFCLKFGKGDASGELVLVGNFLTSYNNNVYNGFFF